MTPAEAYLGGHTIVHGSGHVIFDDKIQKLCWRIYCSAVPTKARMAKLFEYSGFKLEERERWDDEKVKHAFSNFILYQTVPPTGTGKTLAAKYTHPVKPRQILGIDAYNQPYAWSLEVWK